MDAKTLKELLSDVLSVQNQALAQAIERLAPKNDQVPPESALAALHQRVPVFHYDPASGQVFDNWLSRYEELIYSLANKLDNAEQARFVREKLDQLCYDKFSNAILPSKPNELTLADTIAILKRLFGHNLSMVYRRYNFFKCQCDDDSAKTFDDYTGKVNRLHHLADIGKMTEDNLKCFVWVCGLLKPDYEDVRQVALKFLEEKPNATLTDLHSHVRQFIQLQNTSAKIATITSRSKEVNRVQANKMFTQTSKPNNKPVRRIDKGQPPRPCTRCGGNHWHAECTLHDYVCKFCRKRGHNEDHCYTRARANKPRTRQRSQPRQTRRVRAVDEDPEVGSSDDYSTESQTEYVDAVELAERSDRSTRIYRTVKIRSVELHLRQGTGSDVTII